MNMQRDEYQGLPWWALLLLKFGAPWALAGYLIYFATNSIAETQNKIIANQLQIIASQTLLAEATKMTSMTQTEIAATNRRIEMVLVRICINAGKTAEDRARCFD
jgi:hypothetical protein